MKIRGINIRTNAAGVTFIGIHKETFSDFISSTPVNKNGFFAIKLIPLKESPKNYSHVAELAKDREEAE